MMLLIGAMSGLTMPPPDPLSRGLDFAVQGFYSSGCVLCFFDLFRGSQNLESRQLRLSILVFGVTLRAQIPFIL